MKKDFIRDYATEAFRTYAAMGKPTYEEAAKVIFDKALKECEFKDPEIANAVTKKKVSAANPLLFDIMAADRTIAILNSGNKPHIAKAVEEVYFVQPTQPLCRGTISARIRRHSIEAYVSERNVYLWLKEARLLFAALRGLRIPEADKEKIKTLQ